jgi:hypothetical protein
MSLFLIALLAFLSYYSGISATLKGFYKPSIYSRAIWFLITLNSFIGVVSLGNKSSILVLAGIQLIGSLGMLLAAWKHSIRTFGAIEVICSALLCVSLIVWLVGSSPIINVLISLVAHFIGAIPSYINVYKKPASENLRFWSYFALASAIAFATADKANFKNYTYALYFVVFDTSMTLLTARKYLKR